MFETIISQVIGEKREEQAEFLITGKVPAPEEEKEEEMVVVAGKSPVKGARKRLRSEEDDLICL